MSQKFLPVTQSCQTHTRRMSLGFPSGSTRDPAAGCYSCLAVIDVATQFCTELLQIRQLLLPSLTLWLLGKIWQSIRPLNRNAFQCFSLRRTHSIFFSHDPELISRDIM